jgi:drug/metabolite transporter (DMT)-like permease
LSENNKGILFAGITSLFWSMLPIKLKVALGFVDPFTIVWFRFAFATLGLLIILLINDPSAFKIILRPPVLAIIASISLGINYFTYLYGITLTSPGNAQIIIQFGPMLLAIMGIFLFKEKFLKVQYFGLFLLLLGFILFYFNKITHTAFGKHEFHVGSLWVFVAAVAWAVYAAIQKDLVKSIGPQKLNIIFYGVCFFLFLPLTNFKTLSSLNTVQWSIMISLGINTLVAYGLIGEALKRIPANKVGVIITLNPLLTLIFIWAINKMGWNFIQGENLTMLGIFGAFLFLLGAILVIIGPGLKNWPKPNFWR